MSNKTTDQDMVDTLRVKVGELPQKEKRVEEREAESVKGGGGAGGGVLRQHIGEEIPQ